MCQYIYWEYCIAPTLLGTIPPFDSFTTVTTPGNSFYLAPTYSKDHALKQWTLIADEVVISYDSRLTDGTAEGDQGDWDRRMRYRMQKLSFVYRREYLAVTQRQWLRTFPRPMVVHHMWDAKYLEQKHIVTTKQTHFVKTLPSVISNSDSAGGTSDKRRREIPKHPSQRRQL